MAGGQTDAVTDLGILKEHKQTIDTCGLEPKAVAELIQLVEKDKKINRAAAKEKAPRLIERSRTGLQPRPAAVTCCLPLGPYHRDDGHDPQPKPSRRDLETQAPRPRPPRCNDEASRADKPVKLARRSFLPDNKM